MAVQNFGEALRLLRAEKGLSIDDVARRIKIPGRTLQDFENGETNSTLHPVYCRGFAKAYAEFLAMDKVMLEAALNEIYPQEDEEYDSPVLVPPKRRQLVPPGVLTILVVTALLFAGAWYVYAHGWPQFTWLSSLTQIINSNDPPAVAPAETQAQGSGQDASGSPSPQADQTAVPGLPADNTTQSQTTDMPGSGASITPSPEDLVPPVQANATMPSVAAADGPHRLVIATSSNDCWTESKVDDEEKRTVYLKSGQTHILTFQHSLSLRLGNITGIKLRLDGQPYAMPPGRGNTRDLFFGVGPETATETGGGNP